MCKYIYIHVYVETASIVCVCVCTLVLLTGLLSSVGIFGVGHLEISITKNVEINHPYIICLIA